MLRPAWSLSAILATVLVAGCAKDARTPVGEATTTSPTNAQQTKGAPDTPQAKAASPLVLQGHSAEVYGLTFTSDGKVLASSSWDGSIRFWNVPDGKERRVLKCDGGVRSLATMPDGETIVAVGGVLYPADKKKPELKFVSAVTGQEQERYQQLGKAILAEIESSAGNNHIEAVAVSPDGKTLALACYFKIKVWSIQDKKMLTEFRTDVEMIDFMTFSPDSKLLVGTRDNSVRIWDPATGKLYAELGEAKDRVPMVSFSPDGALLALGGARTGLMRVWNVNPFKERNQYQGNTIFGVPSVAFAPRGDLLAVSDSDHVVVLDSKSLKEVRKLPGATGIMRLLFSKQGNTLAGSQLTGQVLLWHLDRP